MAKKKSVYLPMPFVGFEQSFLANVICKNGVLPGADEKTFVGKHSGSRFIFALYRSEFLMKMDAVPHGGGIMLTYRFKMRALIWVVLSLFLFVCLLCAYSNFIMEATDWLIFILFNLRFILLLAVVIGGCISMARKKNDTERKLFQKLGEICCGLLPLKEEGNHNG